MGAVVSQEEILIRPRREAGIAQPQIRGQSPQIRLLQLLPVDKQHSLAECDLLIRQSDNTLQYASLITFSRGDNDITSGGWSFERAIDMREQIVPLKKRWQHTVAFHSI